MGLEKSETVNMRNVYEIGDENASCGSIENINNVNWRIDTK